MKNGAQSKKAIKGIDLMKDSDHTALFSATPLDKAQHLEYLCSAYRLNFREVMGWLGYKKMRFMWQTNQPAMITAQKLDAVFAELTKRGLMVKREVPLKGIEMGINTVDLTPDYKSRYDAAVEKMMYQVSRAESREKGLLKAQWLMKIRAVLEESKIEHAMTELKDSLSKGRQVVLFATQVNDRYLKQAHSDHLIKYTEGTLKKMASLLKEEGIPFAPIYAGNKSVVENVKKFQSGEVQVVLTTPQSGGTGLSLDDTSGNKPRTAVIMTSPFSASDFIQMPGRIHRLTTKSKSEVKLLSTNTDVDAWNRGIIANKMITLGGTVKGDYEKLNIHDMEKVEMMKPNEAKRYM
ncbi:MAG: helicase-related protein, partial [Rhabdochlamydiaceae bacterium]